VVGLRLEGSLVDINIVTPSRLCYPPCRSVIAEMFFFYFFANSMRQRRYVYYRSSGCLSIRPSVR